ncbi:hypothetical protein GGF37_007156 [Kickxella alabastrina]|nr:hypothetical protein GGF37_007156 [Kickxella alabastrina]
MYARQLVALARTVAPKRIPKPSPHTTRIQISHLLQQLTAHHDHHHHTTRTYASSVDFNPLLLQQEAQESMEQGTQELSRGNPQSALSHFNKVLTMRPTPDAHYNAGVCEYMMGQVDRALENWEKAVAMDPTQADAHVNAGNVYFMNKRDIPKAVAHLKKAVELAPRDSEILFNLACMYEASDELDSAIRMYDRAAGLGLEKANAFLRNAMAKKMTKSI